MWSMKGLNWIKALSASAVVCCSTQRVFSRLNNTPLSLSRLSDMTIYQSPTATLTSANLIETDLSDRKPHGRTIQTHSSAQLKYSAVRPILRNCDPAASIAGGLWAVCRCCFRKLIFHDSICRDVKDPLSCVFVI